MMGLVIDFHNHFYPRAYLEELEKGVGFATLFTDEMGRLIINYEGDYNIVADSHINLEERLKAMDRWGIDMQVLTLTTPGVERESVERGVRLARVTNDEFGRIVERYPDRFTALAALPMQDPKAAVEELERAVKECGLRGATLMSNVGGRPLDWEPFIQVYEKAAELDVPLFIHPASPINQRGMGDYRLVPILGFGVDTTLSLLRLVFSGVLKRLPGLKLVASHLGGVFPYLRGRIDRGFEAYPECKVRISEPPTRYLREVWMDSICYDEDVLISTYSFSGAGKIVLGSDYPHQIGDIELAVERIKRLPIGEEEKDMILGENAVRLLKI